MIIINLVDLIPIVIIAILILVMIINIIITSIANKFKKNCFECKYYKLDDVASCGDRCWYRCSKYNTRQGHSMNDRAHFVRCKMFERSENNK